MFTLMMLLAHVHTLYLLLPRVHVQGEKQSILSVCLLSVCPSVCHHHKNRQILRSRRHSQMKVSLRCWECGKTYLLLPSRRLRRAMNAINHVFLSAIPFDHTRLCHVLLQLHMLEFNVGKGC